MKYSYNNINEVRKIIETEKFNNKCKITENSFIRKRKVEAKDIILYELNKKGLSTKMEILNFNNINNVKEISTPGFFKQREKLNPEAFTYLIQESLKNFYNNYEQEVKTYKRYVITAIDGSDFEIPNTKANREKYNGKSQKMCARITISTCYDVLNHYTLDTIIEKFRYSETEMAKRHYETINKEKILGTFKTIRIMDRNYKSISGIYQSVKTDSKFIIRISNAVYEKENMAMKSNDEIIEIGYEYNRVKYYKDKDPEVYDYLIKGNKISVRCLKKELENGEVECLITNLTKDEFETDEIFELYNLRWQIEINYRHLKNNLKIECISSGKEILIKQDILSQVLVSNMLQAFINENDEKIEQDRYKNKMKTNTNLSVGIFKNTLIYIFLEENNKKRSMMMDKFSHAIEKYMVPIKKGRKNPRTNNTKNRYHINRRKCY